VTSRPGPSHNHPPFNANQVLAALTHIDTKKVCAGCSTPTVANMGAAARTFTVQAACAVLQHPSQDMKPSVNSPRALAGAHHPLNLVPHATMPACNQPTTPATTYTVRYVMTYAVYTNGLHPLRKRRQQRHLKQGNATPGTPTGHSECDLPGCNQARSQTPHQQHAPLCPRMSGVQRTAAFHPFPTTLFAKPSNSTPPPALLSHCNGHTSRLSPLEKGKAWCTPQHTCSKTVQAHSTFATPPPRHNNPDLGMLVQRKMYTRCTPAPLKAPSVRHWTPTSIKQLSRQSKTSMRLEPV
jgi:hypothetical protein